MTSLVNKTSLDKASLPDLQETYEFIGQYLEDRREKDMPSAQEQMESMAKKLGYSLEDFLPTPYYQYQKSEPKERPKVPPKYMNPDNHEQTWSGRGRKPLWMVEHLEKGALIDDLLIESQQE